MNKTLTALLALAALGAAHAQSGLKAGLWENRTTLMTVDGKDMAAVLRAAAEQQQKEIASLPPEQRKQAEAVLGRQGGDPLVRRVCISAEMARNEQLLVPRPARADCERWNQHGQPVQTAEHADGAIVGHGAGRAINDSKHYRDDKVEQDEVPIFTATRTPGKRRVLLQRHQKPVHDSPSIVFRSRRLPSFGAPSRQGSALR